MSAASVEASWVLACDERDELRLVRDHSVVIDGSPIAEIVPLNGRFVADDEDATIRRGGEAVETIWSQLRAERWFESW